MDLTESLFIPQDWFATIQISKTCNSTLHIRGCSHITLASEGLGLNFFGGLGWYGSINSWDWLMNSPLWYWYNNYWKVKINQFEYISYRGIFHGTCKQFDPPQPNPFEGMCCAKLRNVIWKLFEDPNSSTAAKVSTIIQDSKKMASCRRRYALQ